MKSKNCSWSTRGSTIECADNTNDSVDLNQFCLPKNFPSHIFNIYHVLRSMIQSFIAVLNTFSGFSVYAFKSSLSEYLSIPPSPVVDFEKM